LLEAGIFAKGFLFVLVNPIKQTCELYTRKI
jgi:hypothetical protein